MTHMRTTAGAKGWGPGRVLGTDPKLGRWTCTGCGHGARTRGEAGDLSVEWLIGDPSTAAAVLARFHHGCRPAGIPGDGACLDCGEGPLIEAALDQPTDLLTASAVGNWFTDHGWSSEPDGRRCPRCIPDSPYDVSSH